MMRFAIVEERWTSGDLRYVRLLRTEEPSRGEFSIIGMFPTNPAPLPVDMSYGDRAEAEKDAALLSLMQFGGDRCSYWTMRLDPAGSAAIRTLAMERSRDPPAEGHE